VHDVAFVELHVKLLLAPLLTVVGDADNVTVGAGGVFVTVTVTLACAVPPAPVQLRMNVVLAFNVPLTLPETGIAPLQPPDAVHDVAFVEVHVKVPLPPLAMVVGDAVNVTVGAGVVLVTETVLLARAVPPAPVQLSVKDVLAFNAPVLCVPAVALLPLQPPDAVHEVAFVELHVKVLLPPLATVVGDADNVTVGAGVALVTVMEALAWAVPPAPVQLSVNVALAFNVPLTLPESGCAPLQPPDAVHDVAFVEVHVKVALPPLAMVVGDAVNVTVGAGVVLVTETVVLDRAVRPPAFVQVIVYVALAFNAPVLSLPESAFAPLHAPDAEHAVARALDQLNVLLPPGLTERGLAESVTVGPNEN